MTPSRRQFVAAIATVPFVSPIASAQRRDQPGAADPVLEQIVAELRSLSSEFEKAQPGSRKSLLRAMESTLAAGAVHVATRYDAPVRQALRRRQSASGRDALVQDLVNRAHAEKRHAVTDQAIDAAMSRLEQHGLSGTFRDVRQTIRKVRLQAPDQIQAARANAVQFDYCSDLVWMIGNLEGIAAVVCALAVLEPTLVGEIPCAGLTLMLGILYLQRQWFC